MYKIDLHTHSIASPDGSITLEDYRSILNSGRLDMVAITDHNTIGFAMATKKTLGVRIIVGEEIKCLEGEIIGLFLSKPVEPGRPYTQTIEDIKDQGGLVYIP